MKPFISYFFTSVCVCLMTQSHALLCLAKKNGKIWKHYQPKPVKLTRNNICAEKCNQKTVGNYKHAGTISINNSRVQSFRAVTLCSFLKFCHIRKVQHHKTTVIPNEIEKYASPEPALQAQTHRDAKNLSISWKNCSPIRPHVVFISYLF